MRSREDLITALRHRAKALLVDRGAAVDPAPARELSEWGLEAPGRVRYAPTGWRLLARALRRERIGPEHVFADLGAGMGRVVVQAARRPFGRVLGVELVPELLDGARANVAAQLRPRQRAKVELVGGDVLDWPVPDDLTHLFLNNPFDGEILRTVLERVVASVRAHPRRLVVIYVNPPTLDVVRAAGPFRTVREIPGSRGGSADRTVILELDVSPPAAARTPGG